MRVRLLVTVAMAGFAAVPAGALANAKPKANDCSDPYWAPTLRCQYAAEGEAPQPNLGDSPADVGQLGPFTRVFLTKDPSVRSVDGTYPVMYVDKAICTTEGGCGDVLRGHPIESDKWLITVPGGGGCTQETCVQMYGGGAERREMSTASDKPMKSLDGIHAPSYARNAEFAGYNRIRVEKSSYDRYMGRTTYESAGGTLVYSHGFLIMQQALEALRNGLNYETWVPEGETVVATKEKLPALAKAEQVVFVGHSGGSHGMFHNIDRLAEILGGFAGFEGDVRVVFDENFIPGIQNESAFSGPPGGDAYSNVWSGVSSGNGMLFTYDGETFLAGGGLTQQYQAWGAPMDASCLAYHGATDGDTWKCNERQHVLLNHVSTPFLLKEDLSDPNDEHNNKPIGHEINWANPVTILTPPEFADRVTAQARSLIELSGTRSESAAEFPTFSVWINDCRTHDGVYDDATYQESRIHHAGTAYSLREWVERFVEAPRTGGSDHRVVGYPGTDMRADCPHTEP